MLEPADCRTRIYDDVFELFEDENACGYYGYGHVPESEFLNEVARFVKRTDPDNDWDIYGPVAHAYAKFTDPNGDRFTWFDVTAETPHSFPLTILEL